MEFNFSLKKDEFYVLHDLINLSLNTRIPHEWYFLNLLLRRELLNNPKLVYPFILFVKQYYPQYMWHFYSDLNWLATASLECDLYSKSFQNKYIDGLEIENDELYKALQFGDIVTDFLIRYKNYSLIKCSEQNIIITAQSDCHKRFEQYLSKGYSLERKAKVGYTGNLHLSEPFGYFFKLPVLPTRDIGYPIDEIIESSEGNYTKIY